MGPLIEITEKETGKVVTSIEYFGSHGDDQRPLREHVKVLWRRDSRAFAVMIEDRFYTFCKVFARSPQRGFVEVSFPGYQEMTGFPEPNRKVLRPRARAIVKEWDQEGRLAFEIFFSPTPMYRGDDPLHHLVQLEVSPQGMKKVGLLNLSKDKK